MKCEEAWIFDQVTNEGAEKYEPIAFIDSIKHLPGDPPVKVIAQKLYECECDV